MENNKLQSAEEYLNENFINVVLDLKTGDVFLSDIHLAMVDFAKTCVKYALKEASKLEETNGTEGYKIYPDSILNSFPITNIVTRYSNI